MEKSRVTVLLKVEKVYIHESTPEANEDIYYPGTLYIYNKPEGKFLEWVADELQTLPNKVPKCYEDHSKSEPSKTRRFIINFDIQELKSIRKSRPTLGWPRLIFILKCGTTCPALHFHDGKCQNVINELQKHLSIIRSVQDSSLFIITKENENPQPKQTSKNYMDLILRNESDSWMDSYSAAFNGLSKVTKFIHDSFLPQTEPFSQLDISDGATYSSSDLTINTDNESGFSFITPAKKELPSRKRIERGNPVSARQWSSYMDGEGRIGDVQKVKEDIFRGGVDPSIRQEVWKFLLGYYSWNSSYKNRVEERKQKIDDYFRMKLQWKSFSADQESRFSALREQKHIIEKDVWRTDRCHKFFQGAENANITVLNDILLTHCMHNFDLGYVQGMSDLLSPILVVMEHEVDAFWCFAGFIKMLAKNFEKDQQAIKNQLCQLRTLLSFSDPDFTLYLEKNDSLNMLFCFRWLLILFKREFSFPDTMRLWEVVWTGLPCQNFHLIICLALLDLSKSTVVENEFGFTEILKYINDLPGRLESEEVLKLAEGIFIQLRDCSHLSDCVQKILGLNTSMNQSSNPFNPFLPVKSPSDSKKSPSDESKNTNPSNAPSNVPSPQALSSNRSVMSSFENMDDLELSQAASISTRTGSIEMLDS